MLAALLHFPPTEPMDLSDQEIIARVGELPKEDRDRLEVLARELADAQRKASLSPLRVRPTVERPDC